jgi:RNA polymerase sigma-70 factor (ECF subfamily)
METRSSLLRRVRDPADAASWNEFILLYEPLLLSYVKSRGLQEHDAHDVVQEIFAHLYKALPGFELDRARGRFRTWLWQVMMNAIADWARRRRRQEKAEEGWQERLAPPGEQDEPDAEWTTAHRQRVLDFVLTRMRKETQPKTWACFELHLLLGRSGKEVAEELGLTANSVYANASRVLARVREQCADYEEDLSHG